MKAGFTMKALSLAVLGLGFGANAMAACPTDPASPAGPWSSKSVSLGALAITSPGLHSTGCAMQVTINQNSSAFAKSFVTDTTPADEPHYRARFYLDTTELTSFTSGLRQVKIFDTASQTAPAGLANSEVQVFLIGGAPPKLSISVADQTQGSGFRVFNANLAVANGVNRFEFDLVQGASSTFRYWLTDDATATTDGAPTGSITGVDNHNWTGVTQTSLGILSGNSAYRANYGNTVHLYFDEFDSRRSTFIGP